MIIEPFNGVFFAMFALFFALLVAASLLLKNKSRKTKRYLLGFAFIFTFAVYWLYKYGLSVDAEYTQIRLDAGLSGFSWWTELPFQLCNINLMLIPLAAFTDNRRLYAFCFFVAPIAALMAIVTPSTGFAGYSIWLPRNLGFYFTHIMIVVGGIAIAAFGLYRPNFRDFPFTFLMIFGIAAFVVGLDFLMKYTVCPAANYFYAMDPEGIGPLEFFYHLVPVPGLYLIPTGIAFLVPYVALVTGGFELVRKASARKKAA